MVAPGLIFLSEERPKRSLSSYMFFAAEARKSIVAKKPDLKVTEVAQEIAKQWNSLSADQKKVRRSLSSSR